MFGAIASHWEGGHASHDSIIGDISDSHNTVSGINMSDTHVRDGISCAHDTDIGVTWIDMMAVLSEVSYCINSHD